MSTTFTMSASFAKTQLCRFHQRQRCKKGQACPFAHGTEELRQAPDLWKTSVCWAWERSTCSLAAAECQYAHGASDLRPKPPMTEAPPAASCTGADGERSSAGRAPPEATRPGGDSVPQPPAAAAEEAGPGGESPPQPLPAAAAVPRVALRRGLASAGGAAPPVAAAAPGSDPSPPPPAPAAGPLREGLRWNVCLGGDWPPQPPMAVGAVPRAGPCRGLAGASGAPPLPAAANPVGELAAAATAADGSLPSGLHWNVPGGIPSAPAGMPPYTTGVGWGGCAPSQPAAAHGQVAAPQSWSTAGGGHAEAAPMQSAGTQIAMVMLEL